MMGKREEAARALHERESMFPWENASPQQRGRAYGNVDAVIACIREPDEKMFAAQRIESRYFTENYQAALDAIGD